MFASEPQNVAQLLLNGLHVAGGIVPSRCSIMVCYAINYTTLAPR